MPFKRPMEIGRVAMINFGEDAGKLIVVSDILDQNRALVDAPGQARRVENFKRLSLTDYKLELPRLAPKKVVIAKFAESDVIAKFGKSSWGQKLSKHASKAAMNDFDRFKAAVAKAKKARAVRKVFSQLQKAAKK
ncbi:ribosomal_L14e domain-containing protein [Haematococcus lacustris]|uniref:Ribosomal_L14e domain-containing protein n=1 Tax=Haematococcus lacustris TaxID=44745 RepID=A0A6A0A540_HAELA|nr:ribosomal_L14e domain-containing protein [Haematococcus lacustris]